MKVFSMIAILPLLLASTAFAAGGASTGGDETSRAVEVAVYGTQMSPDASFNARVLQVMLGELVKSQTIGGQVHAWPTGVSRYRLTGRGDEGGQTFCLELESGATTTDFLALKDRFMQLAPDAPANTGYLVTGKASCD